MKVRWSDLTLEEQLNFGNGCTWVPDFIFTASCRHHDLVYSRGGGITDKIKGDYDLCVRMFDDAFAHRHWYLYMWVSVLYFIGLTLLPFPYLHFKWGRWRTKAEILELDRRAKRRRGIM